MRIEKEFSDRSWPGFRPWLLSVLGSVAVFEFLGLFAWRRESGAFHDPMFALVIVPASALALVLMAGIILRIAARLPLSGTLAVMARMLPLAWAIPTFDLIRTYGNGLVVTPPYLDGKGMLLATATAGILPMQSGISVGIRLGLFSMALFIGLVILHFRKNIALAALGALAWSIIAVRVVLIDSTMSFWHRVFSGAEVWKAPASFVERHVSLAVSDGFWWDRLYELFPSSVASQTALAVRLTGAGVVVLALGILLVLAFVVLERRFRSVLRYIVRAAGSFDIAFYAAVGVFLASVLAHAPTIGGSWWIAISLYVLATFSLRVSSVLARDVARVSLDEARGKKQLITSGELSASEAKDGSLLFLLYALLAAWTLGWPVFAMFIVFTSAGSRTRDKAWISHPWVPALFRAVGAGAITLSGMIFVTRDPKFGALALSALVIAVVHRLLVELVWIPRIRGISA